MKYMGSKNRIAKDILPIILKYRTDNQHYVEPFVGGFNLIDKVDGPRIAADSNEYITCLFKGIQEDFIPPDVCSIRKYKLYKKYKWVHPMTGFIGFGCSYGAKFFNGYARGFLANKKTARNYAMESKNNILKQKDKIIDIDIPHGSIIYNDPPYQGTTKYIKDLDHAHFWEWCRCKVKEDHLVYISEYNAPADFICVWQKEIASNIGKDTGAKKGIEKLFIHESQYLKCNKIDRLTRHRIRTTK